MKMKYNKAIKDPNISNFKIETITSRSFGNKATFESTKITRKDKDTSNLYSMVNKDDAKSFSSESNSSLAVSEELMSDELFNLTGQSFSFLFDDSVDVKKANLNLNTCQSVVIDIKGIHSLQVSNEKFLESNFIKQVTFVV